MASHERPLSLYLAGATAAIGLLVLGGLRLQEAALESALEAAREVSMTEKALAQCQARLGLSEASGSPAQAREPTFVRLVLRRHATDKDAGAAHDVPFIVVVSDKGVVENVWDVQPVLQPGRADQPGEYYTLVGEGLRRWVADLKLTGRACLVVKPAVEWREG